MSKTRLASNNFEFILCEIKSLFLKKKITRFYQNTDNPEIQAILKFLSNHKKVSVFPYPYTANYNLNTIHVEKDSANHLYYVNHNDKRLYLKRKYHSSLFAKRYYNNLLIEQNPASPHCYVTKDFMPQENDIILDMGGAEGIFSLDYIHLASHIYIFECDKQWIEALQYTYRDYSDKVTIIPKYVSDYSSETTISIDDFAKDYPLKNKSVFAKIDIEGAEVNALKGGLSAFSQCSEYRIAVCTYHIQQHEQEISALFPKAFIEHSPGYMIYYYDFHLDAPYLRRGVLRIHNKNNSHSYM